MRLVANREEVVGPHVPCAEELHDADQRAEALVVATEARGLSDRGRLEALLEAVAIADDRAPGREIGDQSRVVEQLEKCAERDAS